MPEVKGVSRDAVHDMGEWNPISKSLEEQDEEERLKDKGGIEVGEQYRTEKKRGMIVGQKKIRGEIKKPVGEAVSRELDPEQKMLADEQDDGAAPSTDEGLDPVAVADAESKVQEERARRRAEEAAAGWSPKAEAQTEADSASEVDDGFFAKFLSKIGIKKSKAAETGIAPGENRKYDKRNMGQKPEYKDKRQEESIH